MRQKSISSLLLLIGIISLGSACSKNEPTVSSVPSITYKFITKYTLEATTTQNRRDSVVVSIGFRDGNGDLGENIRDTTRLKQTFSNQTWGNYQIRTFQFINGRFEEVVIPANAKLFFELGSSPNGVQEGSLDFRQKFVYRANAQLVPVKFQIRLRDRQLNESNMVETDTIRISQF